MIASDCVSTVSPSASTGTSSAGLSCRKLSANCSFFARRTATYSNGRPLRLSAMRMRTDAEERAAL